METCNPAYYKDQVGVAHRCLGGPRCPCSTQYKTPTGQRHAGLPMHELLLMSLTSAGTRGGLQEETLAHPPSVNFSWGSGSSSLARRVQVQMSLRIKTWVPREIAHACVRGPCMASSQQSQPIGEPKNNRLLLPGVPGASINNASCSHERQTGDNRTPVMPFHRGSRSLQSRPHQGQPGVPKKKNSRPASTPNEYSTGIVMNLRRMRDKVQAWLSAQLVPPRGISPASGSCPRQR